MTTDALVSMANEGKALTGVTVIDAHMHNARVAPFFSRYKSEADLLAQMDIIGIDRGIASNLWSASERWESFRGIERLLENTGGRIYAYAAPHPDWEDFEAALTDQARSPAVAGIKLHPAMHRKAFECPQYRFAYTLAAEAKLPVLMHVWGVADVKAITALADEYPGTDFIIGHSGGEENAVALATQAAAQRGNLYLDTACSFVWQGAIEHMVHVAGAKKVLFGSDASWNSMEIAIGRILYADISEEEKRLILGKNAERLFATII